MPVRKKKLDICSKCERSPRPAITAAKSGHVNCLSTAYKDLGVLNERDDYGATPIHYAARFGKLNSLEWLVNCSGVSPNAASSSGSTAAHEAASKGHLDCLRHLILKTNCSAQDRTYEGATVFHMACRFGRSNCAKFLLEQAECSPSDKGTSNVTPVHICAAHDHLSCLKLLTQRADYVPNEVTVHGATPTYFAAQEGSMDCLIWLVNKADGDLYMEATDGMRPIHAAAQGGKLECIKWMISEAKLPADLKAADGATPAHFSAASGQLECLEWLLDNGGSVTDRDDLGGTPAHDAAEQGQIEALELLVNKGADVSVIDNEGLTPMDVAKENQQDECVEMLFKIAQPIFTLSPVPNEEDISQAFNQDDIMLPKDLEKQKMFEDSMMSEMNEDQREVIWTKAKFQPGVKLSPGLKLLLAGEEEPESNVSIDIPTGSLRHSRHSSVCSRLSTKKGNTRSPLTDDVFTEPSKVVNDKEDTETFSTFKSSPKKESVVEQPESSIGDGASPDKKNIKRKESFLKRLFSRKRSSTSVLQNAPPPSKKKHPTKESKASRTSLKENASLQEKIEFHQTALSVEVFDDDGTCLPTVSEEAQQANTATVNSSLHVTTVEINPTPDLVANCEANDDDYNQTAVKTVAESVAEDVVNQAILAVENDISKSVKAEGDKALLQAKTSTKAKVKKKKKKERKGTDIPAEGSHNKANTSSTPFVDMVKKADQDQSAGIKTASFDLEYDTSSESNESNTSDNAIHPMEIEEFEKFGEEVGKPQNQQSADASLSEALLTTPVSPPMDSWTFDQPTNGIPSTVVRAIHKDLQVLSESIDKDLDKLINENQEQEDDIQKIDENMSSSVSNIALEKLEEAQVIPYIPLLQSTPAVVTASNSDSTPVSTNATSLVKQLSSSFSEENHAHAINAASSTTSGEPTRPSLEGRVLKRKSNSIQERLKLFGEKIPEIIVPTAPHQSHSMEESSQEGDTRPLETNKVEENDIVTPLKNISSTSLRRSSLTNVDKLKLDGLKGEVQESLSPEAKKQKWRMSPLEVANKPGSPVAVRRFMDSESRLSSHRLSLTKHNPESLELYMNSANLDHLTKLHEKALDDAKALAVIRTEALLEDPTLNERMAPDAFRKILSQESNKFIWCVKDTWYSWLELMDEFPLELDSEDCYILLHVQDLGPLKYHIFLWMGNKAKDSSMKSTFSWCIKLLQSLPGRPVVYKEAEGHESSLFQSTFQDIVTFTSPSVMFYNDALEKPTLYRYRDAVLIEVEASVHQLGEDIRDVMLLATSTNLFIWLQPQIWHAEPTAIWEAGNAYLTKHSQPLWAPQTILTRHGETKDFFAHLCCWQHASLHLSTQAEQLTLPKRKRQTIRYPAIGKLKIWMLKGSTQSLLPLDKLGQFNSADAYLVEFKFQRWQTVFLWIGSHISYDLDDNSVLMAAVDQCKKMTTKPELILIPQGLETKEFLNLFKGKCLILDPKPGSDVHLYQVSGTDVLRIKTTEVKPIAASLNSSHSFILCKQQKVFAWSGQFSNQAERRGALILCTIVGPSNSVPELLTEGMETPEFWSLLGGKANYSHHSIKNEIPDYYANSVYLYSNNHFIMKHQLSKSELKSTDILLIWTSNEIYLWTGSETNMDDTASVGIVKDYIKHHHARKLNEFVIHLLHEGSEPQHFWDLLVPPSSQQSSSSVDVTRNARRDKLEEDHEEIDSLISDINSMVVNLSTSSVPNLAELATENGKTLSLHHDRFRLMKDSPLSQSCQADLQFAGMNKPKAIQEDNTKTEEKETQPTRQRWSFEVDPTTYQWLTIPAVNHAKMAQKNGKNKNTKGYTMNITVEDQTGASINMVVDSSISAIALAFLAGSELHLALNKDLTLLEVINDIGIERIIEDHEVVKDVVSLWPKKSSARLVVKERKDKHQLWTSAMLEEEIHGFLENDTITRETFSLNTLKKKNKWHNELFCFKHDGVYSMPVGRDTMPVHKQTLVAQFTTHNMYFASKLTKKHPLSGPTSFGLILKPDGSFKEKDCIIMCARDPTSWMKWIQLFRLLKHGAQLKGNYLAIQERLKACQSKPKLL